MSLPLHKNKKKIVVFLHYSIHGSEWLIIELNTMIALNTNKKIKNLEDCYIYCEMHGYTITTKK